MVGDGWCCLSWGWVGLGGGVLAPGGQVLLEGESWGAHFWRSCSGGRGEPGRRGLLCQPLLPPQGAESPTASFAPAHLRSFSAAGSGVRVTPHTHSRGASGPLPRDWLPGCLSEQGSGAKAGVGVLLARGGSGGPSRAEPVHRLATAPASGARPCLPSPTTAHRPGPAGEPQPGEGPRLPDLDIREGPGHHSPPCTHVRLL